MFSAVIVFTMLTFALSGPVNRIYTKGSYPATGLESQSHWLVFVVVTKHSMNGQSQTFI